MKKIYNTENKSKINNLGELRKKLKISAEELSAKTLIGIDTIRAYEIDRLDLRLARFETIVILCETLKTTPVKLFKGEFGENLQKICRKSYRKTIK